MNAIKRFAVALVIACFALALNTRAQTPQLSGVNLTAETGRVRAAAQGDVFDLRMEVLEEGGDTVFEAAQAGQSKPLDWDMRNAQGERVLPGTYTVIVSYTTPEGRPRKRVEQVTLTEEVTARAAEPKVIAPETKSSATEASSSAPNPTPQVDGTGVVNRLAKFADADTLTSSAMFDVGGKIGLGTSAPASKLHLVGEMIVDAAAPTIHTGAAGSEQNRYLHLINSPSYRSASGLKAGGVLVSDTYSYANPKKNDLVVKGNVGIGTSNPAFARLYVLNNGTGPYAVYATGSGGIGVWGNMPNGTGVRASSSTGTGLEGKSGSGVAVSGTSSSNYGVQGVSTSRVGVAGTSNTKADTGAGVAGYNTAGGWAMYAGGNAGQALNAGGWAKFMLSVDPAKAAGSQIVACYNSQLPDGGASQPGCGFTAEGIDVGLWRVNTGYDILRRFALVSVNADTPFNTVVAVVHPYSTTGYSVGLRYTSDGQRTNAPFTLIVY